jgi:hypothetical protein
MQLAFSFDACVPLAPQHDFPPAKDELAANTPATNNAKVVLIMHLRQHDLRNVQWAAPRLRCSKLDRAVFRFCPDGLAFTKFSLENVDAQRIEQVALDRAF